MLATVFADAVSQQEVWREALKEWNMRESKVVNEWKDEGRQEGRQEGRMETLLDVLKDRFGTLPSDLPAHLEAVKDAAVLKQLVLKAIRANSLDDFQKQIPNGNGSAE